jgi:hypothetical protein
MAASVSAGNAMRSIADAIDTSGFGFSAEQFYKQFGILHNMPIPMEGVTLRVFAVGNMANPVRIEILTPIASGILAAHKKRGRIEHVRPVTRTVVEEIGVLGFTERLCKTRRARLIIAIF